MVAVLRLIAVFKQAKKNRQQQKEKKKRKQTQASLAVLLVQEETHLHSRAILDNLKCLRTHFKVDFCLFCTALAANLFKYGRKRWASVWIESDTFARHANLDFCLKDSIYLMLHDVKKLFISNVVHNYRLQNDVVLLKYVCIEWDHRCC